LIAILAWLAVAGLPGTKPVQTAAGAPPQHPPEESFANVAPIYHPQPQQFYAANPLNYPDDNYQDNDAASAPAQPVQTYDQPIATVPSAVIFPQDYAGTQAAPNTIGTFPEPVLYSPYDWPYNPYFGYAQPTQVIIVSNGRNCSRRVGHGPHFDRSRPGPVMGPVVTPRRPRPANFRAAGGTRVVPHLPATSHSVSTPQRNFGAHPSRPGVPRTLASR
jgi:hypothetical protein